MMEEIFGAPLFGEHVQLFKIGFLYCYYVYEI
jgi:hypothetical protein